MTLERVIDWLLYLKDVKRYDRLSVEIDYEILLEIIDFLQELQSCRDTGLTPEQINRLKEGVGISDRLASFWIPCSERLPENDVPVNIVWTNHKPESYYADIKDKPFTATGICHNGKWYWFSCLCEDYLKQYGRSEMDEVDEDIEILFWMPLPELPEQGLIAREGDRGRGRWIICTDGYWKSETVCSLCGGVSPNGWYWKYCPHCGKKMEVDDETL